jgi:acetyltransferase-like isoleucine patch superfamily enzyme
LTKLVFFIGNLIPTFLLTGLISLIFFLHHHQFFLFFLFIYIYLIPILLYRMIYLLFSPQYGRYPLYSKNFLIWWYGAQLQSMFTRFSFLEELLRMIPYCYSLWLTLWGAKLGRYIFWAPKLLIADRGSIEIGDKVLFGYGVKCTSHLISKSHGKDIFIYQKIVIGEEAFIGALTNISPGVIIADQVLISGSSTLLPFSEWKDSK